MDTPPYRPAREHELPPHARYEIDRARNGNKLFCPLVHYGRRATRGLPPLYEDAAHLLKVLVAHDLLTPIDYHRSICAAAEVLNVALSIDATGSDCAEYMLYCLQGLPRPGALKKEAKLKAMIGTIYANLRTRNAITPDK
jgi:hypothetical protein